jgi:hypothetical protein
MAAGEALEAAKADNWEISPSGLRSRIAEMCPPRGAGMLDTGRKRKIGSGKGQTVYDVDQTVDEPFITAGGNRD